MTKTYIHTALRALLPLAGGALGAFLLTVYPEVHAAICNG